MKTEDIKNYHVTETLRDGRTMIIRAVRPEDKGLVVEGLKDVSPESIYRRFFTMKKGITPQGLKLVTEVDFENVVALVTVLEKDGNAQITGGGRYARTAKKRAEVAFLIADPFQGLGIASLLIKHLAGIARDSGITEFEAEVLSSNKAMLRVFARSGFSITKAVMHETIHVVMKLD